MIVHDQFPSEKIEKKTTEDLVSEIDGERARKQGKKDRFSSEKMETRNREDLVFKIFREQARENRKTVVGIVSVLIGAVVFLLIKLL